MQENKVETNTGEMATFTDGMIVIRMRPALNPLIKLGLLQPDAFKWVFAVGVELSECLQRLQNPQAMPTGDGVSTGSHLPHTKFKMTRPRLIGKLKK